MPNVPIKERGNATLGITVAQTLRRKMKITRMTRMTNRCSDGLGPVCENGNLNRWRDGSRQLRKQLLNPIHGLNDVSAGLPLNIHQNCGFASHPGRQLLVLDAVDHIGDVAEFYRRPVAIGDDQRPISVRGEKLIVRTDHVGLPGPVEASLGSIHVRLGDGISKVFRTQAERRHGGRIELNTHRRLLIAFDGHQSHSRNLAQLLGQQRVGKIVDLIDRQRIGGQ
jgi:hypothetical protein